MHHLIVENGPQAGRKYELKADRYVLGRHPECDIVLEVGAVSRQHAAVSRDGNGYFVEDLGSRNGTYLNEEPETIQNKRKLVAGDRIRICDVTLEYGQELFRPARTVEILGSRAELFDDESTLSTSTVMSRLDVSSSHRGTNVSASPEIKLAALIEMMQSLGSSLALDDVLARVLQSLFKIFLQADRGFIVLKEPDGRLVPRWTKVRRGDDTDTIRISRTIVRSVMESKEAILSADAASDERFELSQSIADFRIRSMMCAPLIDNEGNAFGVLQIDTLDQRQRFQAEDLELLVSTASQASVAVQNAQLYERALKQREIERDMQVAHEVQRGFLPDRRPDLTGYSFYDYYQPTDQVGGDYYDYIPLTNGRLAIVVADVVGHGVSAALLMAKLSSETRIALISEATPAKAVTRLNEKLCATGLSRFVTMVMVVLDPLAHKATIVNAGHMAPLHRSGKSLAEPGGDIAGLPLGITEVEYEQFETDFGPGDLMVMYTDGINETIAAGGEFYGIDRLRKFALGQSAGVEALGKTIIDDVRTFLGKAPQNDDMCLVCVGRM